MPKHSGSFVILGLLVCIIVYYGLKFRLLLRHLLRQAPGYWRVKRFTQNLGLRLATTVFNLQLVIADYSSSLSILLSLTKTVMVGVTFVIVGVCGFAVSGLVDFVNPNGRQLIALPVSPLINLAALALGPRAWDNDASHSLVEGLLR